MNRITRDQIKDIERYADALFQEHGIDIEFQDLYKGTHFFDRVNDPRNRSPISLADLKLLFHKVSLKYGDELGMETPGSEGVLRDMGTNVNMPFILKWDSKNRELDLVPKTIMKKRNFVSKGTEYKVENIKLLDLFRTLLLENVVQSKEFFLAVHDWVENPSKTNSDKLSKYKNQIPPMFRKSAILYRGIHLTNDQYKLLSAGKPIVQTGVRSWSHDPQIAQKFLMDPKFAMRSNDAPRKKIILKKKIDTDAILVDIYQYYLFISGSTDFKWDDLVVDSIHKEREVLCIDVKIDKNDIHKIIN